MKQVGTERKDAKCIREHPFLRKAVHRLHFFPFQTKSLTIHYRLECFLMWKHKYSLILLKVVRAHLGSWDSNCFEWNNQAKVCHDEHNSYCVACRLTERIKRYGVFQVNQFLSSQLSNYFMPIKITLYSILKTLSKQARSTTETIRLPHFLWSVVSCASENFYRLNKWVS